jgi:hypothetical protein
MFKALFYTTIAAYTFSYNRLWSRANCKGNLVTYRHYYENECRTLSSIDHGVETWYTGSPCTRKFTCRCRSRNTTDLDVSIVYAYESDDCTGNRAPLASPDGPGSQCDSLQGRWSVVVTDCNWRYSVIWASSWIARCGSYCTWPYRLEKAFQKTCSLSEVDGVYIPRVTCRELRCLV